MSSRDESTAAERLALSRLTIDLDRIVANWRLLGELTPSAETSAVVKADAYGLGIARVVPALAQAGCRTFFVAWPHEGLAARAAAPSARIFVLGGLTPETGPALIDNRLIPVLNSMREIETWQDMAAVRERRLACALHFDTGMNRLGFEPGEAERIATEGDLVARLEPALVMSHLACADTPLSPMNGEQFARFKAIRALFPGIAGSLANSAAILSEPEFAQDVTRPGIALYGGAALASADGIGSAGPVMPVVTFEARILQVRNARKGETVGYGATAVLARDSRIAIAAAGYADGYLRSAAGGVAMRELARAGKGFIADMEAPLVGRISMDLAAFDVTDIPGEVLESAEWIELIGDNGDLDEFAHAAGTIGYEVLTGIGPRAARVYVGG